MGSFALIPFFQDGNTASLLSLALQNLKRLPAMLIAAYTFNDYLLPHFYAKRKYLVFGVMTLLLFYVCSALDRMINVYVYEPLFRDPPFVQESIQQILSEVSFLIGGYLPSLLIASLIMTLDNIIREKRAAENRNLELERDKNMAELNALKSQLHPHFLFNTLNNLYALTVQKSDKAPETVATLSAMLDYILYQCNDKLVPLKKEVELLENYIALEKLRYGGEIKIRTEYAFAKAVQSFIEGDVQSVTTSPSKCPAEWAETKIAPLLLLSIVENSFKHGASGSVGTPEIHINIREEGKQLFIEVNNTKNAAQQLDVTGYSKGIGVPNVKRQLALLYSDFSYEETDENGWFMVALRINTTAIND
jgi:sensor histidine kinase YesM